MERCHGSGVSWKPYGKGVMEASVMERRRGSVMERRHGSDASWKRRGKGVMEVSVMERRHGSDVSRKRHGKVSWKWCVMDAPCKGVMEVMCQGSVMEKV